MYTAHIVHGNKDAQGARWVMHMHERVLQKEKEKMYVCKRKKEGDRENT